MIILRDGEVLSLCDASLLTLRIERKVSFTPTKMFEFVSV